MTLLASSRSTSKPEDLARSASQAEIFASCLDWRGTCAIALKISMTRSLSSIMVSLKRSKKWDHCPKTQCTCFCRSHDTPASENELRHSRPRPPACRWYAAARGRRVLYDKKRIEIGKMLGFFVFLRDYLAFLMALP